MSTIEPLEGKGLSATQIPEGTSMVMFDGAVRASKSVSADLMWLRFLRNAPSGALAIIGRTESTAINNVILPIQEMLGTKRVVINRGLGIVTMLGRVVNIYGANDAAAYTKIQGLTLAGAYVDEGASIHETFFNMLRSRLSVPGALLFLTCNPEGPKHWLKGWLDRAAWHLDKRGRLKHNTKPDALPIWRVTFLLDDNLWLARHNPKFVAELKATWPKGSVFHKRYIDSEWVSAEGAVYGIWHEEEMTLQAEQLPYIERVLSVGFDFGSDHPTRAYLIGLTRVNFDPAANRPDWESTKRGLDLSRARWVLIVLDEFAPEGGPVAQQATRFEAWLDGNAAYGPPEWIAVDPAAKTFRDELHARGRSDVMRAHNAVVPGIQTVESLFYARRMFVVADRCPELLTGIPGYMWSKKATEAGRTEPVKENDDEVDALRYGVYSSRRYWRDHIPLAPINESDSEELAA